MANFNNNQVPGQIPSTDEIFRLLLAAIEAEEISLADLINAEADKVRAILGLLPGQAVRNPSIDELERIDSAVERVLRGIIKKEIILNFELEDILDFLSSSTTTASTTTTQSTTSTASTTTTTTGRSCAGQCGVVGTGTIITPDSAITVNVSICDGCGTIDTSTVFFQRTIITDSENLSFTAIPTTIETSCDVNSITITADAIITDDNGTGIGTIVMKITQIDSDNTVVVTATRPGAPDQNVVVTFPAGTFTFFTCPGVS